MKKIVIGMLAHVDAGKTTLSEAILYTSGAIRKIGRVDHQDTFLDNVSLERERGITIFSKQAMFSWEDMAVTLLDTPGHVDFSAEMERTLQVLDYAILVISGTDGVQSHTRTLWELLHRYQIPTFLFINKMDMQGTGKVELLANLTTQLDGMCVDFTDKESDEFFEHCAMGSEECLEYFLEHGSISEEQILDLIAHRKIFPCLFGSALKLEGVDTLLASLSTFTRKPSYGKEFGARVFKVSRDETGNTLTYMKITGGSLKPKDVIVHGEYSEKVNQLRAYSGTKYTMLEQAEAGDICAVKGLEHISCGMGLGEETEHVGTVLEPVLDYRVMLLDEVDAFVFLKKLKVLEQEDPTLRISWKESTREIHIRLMGMIQLEVLKRVILERFDTEVSFDAGTIMYKETLRHAVEGVGHYEPLKHYGEVHLLMEPLPQGSGLEFALDCREDALDKNWQRLIYTHLLEKEHLGVLTGSPLTDMRLTVVGGKAHLKHTEGGDFRQATYRAVRQGMMMAESVLLEPVYRFYMELPTENVGRAMADIEQMHGNFEAPMIDGEVSILKGTAPVATMKNYQAMVASYTKGLGKCSLTLDGYAPCHNQEEVVLEKGYNPDEDMDNPSCSVFCAHGAGYLVPWHDVYDNMHVEGRLAKLEEDIAEPKQEMIAEMRRKRSIVDDLDYRGGAVLDQELEAIFNRTYGGGKEERRKKYANTSRALGHETVKTNYKPKPKLPECLLVDGYNVIFAWDSLKELAERDLGAARDELISILSNYHGFRSGLLIVVFDAYKVKGNSGEVYAQDNIYVVYTKEAETADMYIERTTHEKGKDYNITVATSDALEQLIVMGQGAKRISSRELAYEIEQTISSHMEQFELQKTKEFQKILSEIKSDML